jgi:hypothetical protein
MLVTRWRRAAAVYLALFFCAVVAAPHAHVNGLEDLLLDQASDSGIIAQPVAGPVRGATVVPLRYVHDIPCPACFTSDFVTTAASAIAVVPRLTPLHRRPEPVPASRPELLPAESVSRAPPSV